MKNTSLILFLLFFVTMGDSNAQSWYRGKKESSPEVSIKIHTYKNYITDENGAIEGAKSKDIEYEIKDETPDRIIIEPRGNYYSAFLSHDRMTLPRENHHDDIIHQYQYPTIDYYIVNNSDKPLNITSLYLDVEESRLDDMPFVYFYATDGDGLRLYMNNYSQINWGYATLEYTILREGEAFDGTYKSKRVIPFFKDTYELNFASELKMMGLKLDGDTPFSDGAEYRYYCPGADEFYDKIKKLSNPFPVVVDREYGGTKYYHGVAPIYGKLSFPTTGYSVDFLAEIIITSDGGYGGAGYISDEFSVELNSSGQNYKKLYPHKSIIRPFGTQRVRLIISAPQSSKHRLVLRVNNAEGRDIHSKVIDLHLLNHKNAVFQKSTGLD